MKYAKKLVGLLLALVMVFAMSVTAFAANGTNSNDGKITIDNAVVGETYTIYQILTLESYDTEAGAYSYKATKDWEAFAAQEGVKDVYLKTDAQGYVTWVGDQTAERVSAFAALAKAYAANKTPAASKEATAETVEFTGLNLGYYLLDSSLGTLCSLDTASKEVTIKEKNGEPTNEKTVQEDSTGNYGPMNDADIGQTVNFKSEVTLPKGSENVTFHDTMSAGLTLNGSSIKVYTDAALTAELAADNYTVTTTGLTDGCTFEVSFKQTYLDSLGDAGATVYVGYAATVNANAIVGGAGNPNTSKIEYGEEGKTKYTPDSTTITYTWSFDVLKYGNGDKSKVLEGAEFVLLNSEKTKVATIVDGKLTSWVDVPAADNDGTITWPEGTVQTTDAQGKIHIDGLDADTYYLREIKAPAGYNILKEDVEVKITPMTGSDGKTLTLTPVTAEIENKSGTELPSTGGMGTTIFYVVGSILLIGAAVLLITKKRMNPTK